METIFLFDKVRATLILILHVLERSAMMKSSTNEIAAVNGLKETSLISAAVLRVNVVVLVLLVVSIISIISAVSSG